MARGHDPVADFGVHPGELDSKLAGCQQSARVHFDSVTRTANVPGNNVREYRIEFVAYKLQIAGVSKIGACRFKEPERSVNRVVFRCFAGIWKTVGQHAL